MTQQDVLDWVLAHGCEITHSKKTFYRVTNKNGDAMGIPQPREGHSSIQPMTVCRICNVLGVPIPDYSKEAFELYTKIQQDYDKEK